MRLLAIETSCDETAAAVVEDGRRIVSNVVSTQAEIHAVYGGVVPELASRHHIENIVPVIRKAMQDAGMEYAELDAVAVTRGPGLIGSLLVGIQAAKAIAFVHGKPLVPVHHIAGHLQAPFLATEGEIPLPAVALVVSGGHTSLFEMPAQGEYHLLGRTRDDAAGEAFDKVAKLLGLGYPGGPVIDRLARGANALAHDFSIARMKDGSADFSFSGIKTAVLYHVKREGITPATECFSA
jgi:N6-L-threonylcarbamoyladenine synthase